MAASFLLFISAALSLGGGGKEAGGDQVRDLLGRGWQKTDRLPCPGALPGMFFEIEGEDEATEAFVATPGLALAARLPFPTGGACREIGAPQFIEEIR